jgi:hypothetical protein
MSIRTLAEVAAYIEEHSRAHPSSSDQEEYQGQEDLCIAILDSQFDNYPEGVLQDFLMDYLAAKRKQLGL